MKSPSDHFASAALAAGCPLDQMQNFVRAGVVLQPRQLAASAASRLCDRPDGPTAIGFGGGHSYSFDGSIILPPGNMIDVVTSTGAQANTWCDMIWQEVPL